MVDVLPYYSLRRFAGALLACVLLPGCAPAADALGCLEFQPHPVASDGRLDGTAINSCAKGVTAYSIELKIFFSDGSAEAARGLGRDFLPGVGIALAGSGQGAVVPGERRPINLATLQPAQMQRQVARTTVTAYSIIFDDATALGDEHEIVALFRDRSEDLRELIFWNQTFAKHKDEISSQGPLARLIELSQVRTPERSKLFPHSPLRVETMADMMQQMLEWSDQAIENGSMSRAQALHWLDRYLSTMVTTYEKHSERTR